MSDNMLNSYIGYLRDCAVATVRSLGLDNVFKDPNAPVIDLPPSALEDLAVGEYVDYRQETWDLALRMEASNEEEEQIFLGLLFFVGKPNSGRRGPRTSICAPLLMTRLRTRRDRENRSVAFDLAEDEFQLNLGLFAKLIALQGNSELSPEDEEELTLRFQDLLDALPGWPVVREEIESFLDAIRRTFSDLPGFDHTQYSLFHDFKADPLKEVVPLVDESVVVSNAAVFIHKSTPDMTVVQELTELAKTEGLFGSVLSDIIHLPSTSSSPVDVDERESPTNSDDAQAYLDPLIPLECSDTQRQALNSVVHTSLTVIAGPPGTGKSYTIAALILDHIIKGKTVLMASRSKKAVSVVVEMLRDIGGPYIVGVSGDRDSQRELSDHLESMTAASSPLRPVAPLRIEEQRRSHKDLQRKIAHLTELIERQLPLLGRWSHHADNARALEDDATRTIKVQQLSQEEEELCRRWLDRGSRILTQGKVSWLRKWRGRKYIKTLSAQVGATTNRDFSGYSRGLDFLHHRRNMDEIYEELSSADPLEKCWGELEIARRESISTAKLILKLTRQRSLALFLYDRSKKEMLRMFMRALRARNTRRKRSILESIDKHILLEAFPVWACTTPHVSQFLPLEKGLFDLVVIDEASQVDLASAVPVIYRGKKAVIVGDDKQLNAVIFISKHQEMAAFARNAVPDALQETHRYSQKSLYDVASDKVRYQDFHMLDEHFRSRPPIIGFSNSKFYESRLRIMTARPTDQSEPSIFLHHVLGARSEGTTVNPTEVTKVLQIVEDIVNQWRKAPPDAEVPTIGVVSPFRDQVDAINQALAVKLESEVLRRHRLVHGTAHSLQGDEKSIVILSLSIDPTFHHSSLRFLQTPQVFNVAITRAQKQLHVVTSVRSAELPDGLLKEFLEYIVKAQVKASQNDGKYFRSDFEREVYFKLEQKGYAVHTNYPACGFEIDLVPVHNGVCIGVECDGPKHFNPDGSYTERDVWRHTILRRAGWNMVHVTYFDWRANPEACLQRIEIAMDRELSKKA